MSDPQFFPKKLNSKNIAVFVIRRSILRAFEKYLGLFNGKLLDVGCGKMPYREFILKHSNVSEYVGIDIESAKEYDAAIKPDLLWDGIELPIENESYDTILATEVLEHCPDTELVLKEIFRVLNSGGVFFYTVPFLWNLHEVPHDEYRFTPFSLERHIKKVGFKEIEIVALGGWHASLAQLLGAWVKRSPIRKRYRILLMPIIKIIMLLLIKQSEKEKIQFREGQMITGLYGVAIKL